MPETVDEALGTLQDLIQDLGQQLSRGQNDILIFLRLALSAKDENVAIFYFDPHSLIVVEPEVQCLWGVKLRPTSHDLISTIRDSCAEF